MAAALDKIKAFWDSQYHNEENWALNYVSIPLSPSPLAVMAPSI
jgi:hypothetical protein